jgi:hypothetical protein
MLTSEVSSFDIVPVHKPLFEATGCQNAFADYSASTDACYKLKAPVNVGEQVEFELTAASELACCDNVEIAAAVEPGIPNGLSFGSGAYSGGLGRSTRTVTWTPRPGQQGTMHAASFVALIPPKARIHTHTHTRIVLTR